MKANDGLFFVKNNLDSRDYIFFLVVHKTEIE